MRDDRLYIHHILDCVRRIDRYCQNGEGAFRASRAIAGFRNVLVHDYLGINLDRVWEIVSVHLPVLGSQMEAIRREAGPPE